MFKNKSERVMLEMKNTILKNKLKPIEIGSSIL